MWLSWCSGRRCGHQCGSAGRQIGLDHKSGESDPRQLTKRRTLLNYLVSQDMVQRAWRPRSLVFSRQSQASLSISSTIVRGDRQKKTTKGQDALLPTHVFPHFCSFAHQEQFWCSVSSFWLPNAQASNSRHWLRLWWVKHVPSELSITQVPLNKIQFNCLESVASWTQMFCEGLRGLLRNIIFLCLFLQ